jgi:hypothetical protein
MKKLSPDRNCRRCEKRPGDPTNRFGYARLCDECWWELHTAELDEAGPKALIAAGGLGALQKARSSQPERPTGH